MRIFLSHQSRHKPLVREFKHHLPTFLHPWLDEESLTWGATLDKELRSAIQSSVDFLIILLDKETLNSAWVKQELEWAMQRENELSRSFVLPILLETVPRDSLPLGLSDRLHLRLADYNRESVESLAQRASQQLFQLVATSYSNVDDVAPRGGRAILNSNQISKLGIRITEPQANHLVTKKTDVTVVSEKQIPDGYELHVLRGYPRQQGVVPNAKAHKASADLKWVVYDFHVGNPKKTYTIEVWLVGESGQALLDNWQANHEIVVKANRELEDFGKKESDMQWLPPITRVTTDMHRCQSIDVEVRDP